MTMTAPQDAAERRDALVGRLFEATLGAFDLLTIHLGAELGLYRALAERGPLTAAGARRRDRHRPALRPRVARAAGRRRAHRRRRRGRRRRGSPLLAAGGLRGGPRRPDESRADRPAWPSGSWVAAPRWPTCSGAYRTGGGVAVGPPPGRRHRPRTGRTGRSSIHSLTQDWLAGAPRHRRSAPRGRRPDRRRRAAAPAGRRSRFARGYPKATVDGLDLDTGSIAHGQRPPRERCPGRRRPGHLPGARRGATRSAPERYDLVLDPRGGPRHVPPGRGADGDARLLAPGGALLIADERSATSSPRPATRSSGSCTATACCSACRTGSPTADSIGTGTVLAARPGCGDARPTPASRASRPADRARQFRFYRLDP